MKIMSFLFVFKKSENKNAEFGVDILKQTEKS